MIQWLLRFKNRTKKPIPTKGINKSNIERYILEQNQLYSNNSSVTVIVSEISLNVVDGSSIWLSSIANIFNKCSNVIIISKDRIQKKLIVSNLTQNIVIIDPVCISTDNKTFNNAELVEILKYVDDIIPNVQNIVVRGLDLTLEIIKHNQFFKRLLPYLTNIYNVDGNVININNLLKENILLINNQTKYWLLQTPEFKDFIEKSCNIELINYHYFTPTLPDVDFGSILKLGASSNKDGCITIGYAGKIQPDWGVLELLEQAKTMYEMGFAIRVKIISSKLSSATNFTHDRAIFIEKIKQLLVEPFVEYISDVNRQEAIDLLNNVDYIWAYRPAYFENSTLELSTKLLEGVALGVPTICYPNIINIRVLGESYPYFLSDVQDLAHLIGKECMNNENFTDIVKKIRHDYSFDDKVKLVNQFIKPSILKKILFASHDFKFIDHYISHLKLQGFYIYKDIWNWGDSDNLDLSRSLYQKADIIFCEWGLANAVWYSQNNIDNKPLYVRIHQQEIYQPARKFGGKIAIDSVTCIISVSHRVLAESINLWGWPSEKTSVISNYVLDNDFLLKSKTQLSPNLGIVGITPSRKRLDRAIDLIAELLTTYPDAKLYIKGKRPEEYEWMHAPGRVKELDYYYEQYKRLDSEPLKSAVIFDDFSNDMAKWYHKIDFILSPSDFESFHYSVADGVLCGCIPVIWPWDEAHDIYDPSWVIDSTSAALDFIVENLQIDDLQMKQKINRKFITTRYGAEKIYFNLSCLLGLI